MRWMLSGLIVWLGLGCGDVHTVSLGSHMLVENQLPDAGTQADAEVPDAAKPDEGDDHGDDDDDAEGGEKSGKKSGDGSDDKEFDN
jgi:hypothetical protein